MSRSVRAFSDGRQTGAFSAQARLGFKRWSLNGQLVGTQDGYPGRFRDAALRRLSGSYRPVDWVSLTGSVNYRESRFGFTTFGTDQNTAYYANGRFTSPFRGFDGFLRLTYSRRDYENDSDIVQRSSRREQVQIEPGYDLGPVRLSAPLQFGRVRSLFDSRGQDFASYAGRAVFTRTALSGSLELGYRTDSRFSDLFAVDGDRYFSRGSITYRLNERTRVSSQVNASINTGPSSLSSTAFTLRGEHVFLNAHRVELEGRYFKVGSFFDFATLPSNGAQLAFTYTLPFYVPSFGRTPGRVVRGRIVDEATGRGRGGIELQLGETKTRTQADGSFEFRDVQDGQYTLSLDRLSAGLEYLPLLGDQMTLDVNEFSTDPVEIPLARRAQLRGRVVRYTRPSARSERLDEAGPLRGVIVIARSPLGQFRAVTDAAGFYSFPELRPGLWEVQLLSRSLPDETRQAEVLTLTLDPGVAEEQDIRVVPRQKRIQMQEAPPVRR